MNLFSGTRVLKTGSLDIIVDKENGFLAGLLSELSSSELYEEVIIAFELIRQNKLKEFSMGYNATAITIDKEKITIEHDYVDDKPDLIVSHNDFLDTMNYWIPKFIEHEGYKEIKNHGLQFIKKLYSKPLEKGYQQEGENLPSWNKYKFWIESKEGYFPFSSILLNVYNDFNFFIGIHRVYDDIINNKLDIKPFNIYHTRVQHGKGYQVEENFYTITMNKNMTYYGLGFHEAIPNFVSVQTKDFIQDLNTWYDILKKHT